MPTPSPADEVARPAPVVITLPPTPTPATPTTPAPPVRGQLFKEGEPDLVKPECLKCPTDYPGNVERARLEGVVLVEILVDEAGRVHQPRALGNAHKELKKAAVDNVKDWQYSPATRQGVPGKMVLVVELNFTLPGTRRR